MKPCLRVVTCLVLLAAPIFSQIRLNRNNFYVGVGAGQPRADLANYFNNTPGLNFGYGYRFHPYFQADAGLETLFGAAGVRSFLNTDFGSLRIRDFQWLVPLGGRVIVPIKKDRAQLYAGGGAAYMRYSERLQQPFGGNTGFRLACPPCQSRDGWGNYVLVGGSYALDSGRHFRIGATGRLYRGYTDGEPLGAAPATRTRDNWLNLTFDFTFSF